MPTATTDTSPYPALDRATFAKLSPYPFLSAHLEPADPSLPPIRPSGRSPTTFRTPTCTTSSLTHCAGSAVVRVGDTAVVCGIQAEILLASDIADPPRNASNHEALSALSLLVPNVELATGCSPSHLPGAGGPPSTEAQTLSHRLLTLLLSSRLVELEDLRIKHTPTIGEMEDGASESTEKTVAYWTLYASVHVLSLSGSRSLFDAAWAALLAALRDVRLPRAWWDSDVESILCSDRVSEARRLNLRGLPISATWGVFVAAQPQTRTEIATGGHEVKDDRRAWLLADPDDFEDPLCKEGVTIVVDCSNGVRLLKIEKHGGAIVGKDQMAELLAGAKSRWEQWNGVLA